MMTTLIKFEALGYRDVMGRYAERTEALDRGLRDLVREETKALWSAMRYYAPEKTGKFKAGLRYRTDVRGEGRVTGTIYAGGPHAFLLPIFIYGSRPHTIVARRARALRFFWERGPRGPGIYYYKSVQRPGTDPHPFIAQAMDSREPHLGYNLYKLARSVTYLRT